jgi:hypothetical protein
MRGFSYPVILALGIGIAWLLKGIGDHEPHFSDDHVEIGFYYPYPAFDSIGNGTRIYQLFLHCDCSYMHRHSYRYKRKVEVRKGSETNADSVTGMKHALKYLPVFAPLAVLNGIGSLQCLASAKEVDNSLVYLYLQQCDEYAIRWAMITASLRRCW